MIVFRNHGLIDLTAVRTLGVSVKEEGAIGYFGTGLKFAIATVLRRGGSIVIWRGPERYEMATSSSVVRGKDFDIVTMNGQELGFTTQLGRDWEPWMAFRELACNARDEGGEYYRSSNHDLVSDDETVIEVTGGGIDEAYHNRFDIILEGEPLESTAFVDIHPGPSDDIYYRGVKVGEMLRPTFFRYNIRSKINLTEDRTFKYHFETHETIAKGLIGSKSYDLIHAALTCGDDYMEHHLSFSDNGSASEAFLKVAGNLRSDLNAIERANPSALILARTRVLSSLGPAESIVLGVVEQDRLRAATGFLASVGYDIGAYPMVIVEELGNGIYGLASEGKIFISRAAFQKGTKEVASTLLEEFVHLKTGFGDNTRQLQTWLFDELLLQAEHRMGIAL